MVNLDTTEKNTTSKLLVLGVALAMSVMLLNTACESDSSLILKQSSYISPTSEAYIEST